MSLTLVVRGYPTKYSLRGERLPERVGVPPAGNGLVDVVSWAGPRRLCCQNDSHIVVKQSQDGVLLALEVFGIRPRADARADVSKGDVLPSDSILPRGIRRNRVQQLMKLLKVLKDTIVGKDVVARPADCVHVLSPWLTREFGRHDGKVFRCLSILWRPQLLGSRLFFILSDSNQEKPHQHDGKTDRDPRALGDETAKSREEILQATVKSSAKLLQARRFLRFISTFCGS